MKFQFEFLILYLLEFLFLGYTFLIFFQKEKYSLQGEIYFRLHTAIQSFLFSNQKENQLNQLDSEFLDKLCSDLSVENLYIILTKDKLSFDLLNSSLKKSLEDNPKEIQDEYLSLEKNQKYIQDKVFTRIILDREYYSHLILANIEEEKYFLGVDLKSSEYLVKMQTFRKIYVGLFIFSYVTLTLFTYQFLQYKLRKRAILLWILEFVFLVLASVATCYFLFQYWQSKIYEKYNSKLYVAAKSLNYVLPLDYHDKLEEKGEEIFYELKSLLSKFAEFLDVYYAYTIVHKNGKFFYSATNETEADFENSTVSQFLDEIDEVSLPIVEKSYWENKTFILNQRGTIWGDFRSIFIPQKSIRKQDLYSCCRHSLIENY